MTTVAERSTAFDPPGPGGWRRLADHFPGALTPEYQLLYAETCPPGMAAYLARYGVLARTLDVAFVHGHLYIAPVPLAGPREMRRPPPGVAIWVISRLHPAFRRRTRAAQRALRERPWRTVAAHWFEVERLQWGRRDAATEAIEPAALDTAQLGEHLRACRSLVVDGYRRHFELHGDDMLPVGLLVVRCGEWGISPDVAIRALDAVPRPDALDVTPRWVLVTGYDLDNSTAAELPVTRASTGGTTPAQPVDLRELVPARDHDELADLVDDARDATRLRDDNGILTGAWPMGLLRRAMLEAGRRTGLPDPALAVEATVDELLDRLSGGVRVDAGELGRRQVERARRSALAAPLTLGPDFALPPLTALPRPLALIGGAQLAMADHMAGDGTARGIGSRTYTGRALVVDDPHLAMAAFEPGDVLVTRATSPSWNALLVHAGALVTTTGGLVSHAAITARELGIPAVIGDATAFDRLVTGSIVTVDPARASVTVTGESAR